MKLNACHNRPEFRRVYPAQDGFYLDGTTRTPRLVAVPHRMSTDCVYGKNDGRTDPGCEGCRWRDA